MYLVTGGAGFVGSNLIRALNERSMTDIIVVDNIQNPLKAANLSSCRFEEQMFKSDFRDLLHSNRLPHLDAIWHLGACTDTGCSDIDYLNDNNLAFSIELLDMAVRHQIPFVYASSSAVYGRQGGGSSGVDLTAYAASKFNFDQYVERRIAGAVSTVVGLRFFNTYGPHERHKGRMASMVYQIFRQLVTDGVATLYQATDGFNAGEQRRDFVHVDDVVRVNIAAIDGAAKHGIVDVGTGVSRSFNDVVAAFKKALGFGAISYVPIDPQMQKTYQSFSQADLTDLRALALPEPRTALEEGIAKTIPSWLEEDSS